MELWSYSETTTLPKSRQMDLVGYQVHARDGDIGKVDEATYETGSSALVVDTGFWIFGKKRVIPAGMIERIDADDRTVHVRMTKEQVKSSPDFDESTWRSGDYRSGLSEYYRTF